MGCRFPILIATLTTAACLEFSVGQGLCDGAPCGDAGDHDLGDGDADLGDADADDPGAADGDAPWCPRGSACTHGGEAGFCAEDDRCDVMGCDESGTWYPEGSDHPVQPCLHCVARAWTEKEPLASCAGGVCVDGACDTSARCYVDGQWFDGGAASPSGPCAVCDPAVDRRAFTPIAEGLPCSGVAGLCDSGGACVVDRCFVGGAWYATGEPSPTNACQVCKPTVSRTSFRNAANGTGCGATGGRVGQCAGGSCCFGCRSGAQCYPGETVDACGIQGKPCGACSGICWSCPETEPECVPDCSTPTCQAGECI